MSFLLFTPHHRFLPPETDTPVAAHLEPALTGLPLWNHWTVMVGSETGIRRDSKCARWPSLMETLLSEVVNTGACVVTSSRVSERVSRDRSSRYWTRSRPDSC